MSERLPFIDWMKALGMLIIVYGHAPAGHLVRFTEPFNPKQLGVVFFIFVLGFSLAREIRPPARVVFNRLFEVFVVGFLAALAMTAIVFLAKGRLAESNYLPFLLGANVFLNFFPANQTTWYIGMYLHMVLFWALLARRFRVEPWMIVLSLVIEIVVRAALLSAGVEFVAYMLITNWMTVFLLGAWFGQQEDAGRAGPRGLWLYLALLLALSYTWLRWAPRFDLERGFPFNVIQTGSETTSWLLTSTVISALYLLFSWLVYEVTTRLPDLAPVRFFARNTLVVFIVHLPLVRVFSPWIYEHVEAGWLRVVVNLLIYFVGLSFFSELVRRLLPMKKWRDLAATRIWPAQPAGAV